jgi:hypothetical protein
MPTAATIAMAAYKVLFKVSSISQAARRVVALVCGAHGWPHFGQVAAFSEMA